MDPDDITLVELIDLIEFKLMGSPLSVRADFMVDVAHVLRLDGDERALLSRTYAQAETEWGNH